MESGGARMATCGWHHRGLQNSEYPVYIVIASWWTCAVALVCWLVWLFASVWNPRVDFCDLTSGGLLNCVIHVCLIMVVTLLVLPASGWEVTWNVVVGVLFICWYSEDFDLTCNGCSTSNPWSIFKRPMGQKWHLDHHSKNCFKLSWYPTHCHRDIFKDIKEFKEHRKHKGGWNLRKKKDPPSLPNQTAPSAHQPEPEPEHKPG